MSEWLCASSLLYNVMCIPLPMRLVLYVLHLGLQGSYEETELHTCALTIYSFTGWKAKDMDMYASCVVTVSTAPLSSHSTPRHEITHPYKLGLNLTAPPPVV